MADSTDRNAFTIVELIAVLVIIAILSIVAIPNLYTFDEKNKAKGAQSCLTAIQSMEKRFYSRNGVYYTVDPNIIDKNGAIAGNLKITLDQVNFDFDIKEVVPGKPESGYIAQATRKKDARNCPNKKMYLYFNNETVNKTECGIW